MSDNVRPQSINQSIWYSMIVVNLRRSDLYCDSLTHAYHYRQQDSHGPRRNTVITRILHIVGKILSQLYKDARWVMPFLGPSFGHTRSIPHVAFPRRHPLSMVNGSCLFSLFFSVKNEKQLLHIVFALYGLEQIKTHVRRAYNRRNDLSHVLQTWTVRPSRGTTNSDMIVYYCSTFIVGKYVIYSTVQLRVVYFFF